MSSAEATIQQQTYGQSADLSGFYDKPSHIQELFDKDIVQISCSMHETAALTGKEMSSLGSIRYLSNNSQFLILLLLLFIDIKTIGSGEVYCFGGGIFRSKGNQYNRYLQQIDALKVLPLEERISLLVLLFLLSLLLISRFLFPIQYLYYYYY